MLRFINGNPSQQASVAIRISRSSDSLEVLEAQAADDGGAIVTRVVTTYGHASGAEAQELPVLVLWGYSDLALNAVIALCKLIAAQMQSTRFQVLTYANTILFLEQLAARGCAQAAEALENKPYLRYLFDQYEAVEKYLRDRAAEFWPQFNDSQRNTLVCDAARMFLPVCVPSRTSIQADARAWNDIISLGLVHPLEEVRMIAQDILDYFRTQDVASPAYHYVDKKVPMQYQVTDLAGQEEVRMRELSPTPEMLNEIRAWRSSGMHQQIQWLPGDHHLYWTFQTDVGGYRDVKRNRTLEIPHVIAYLTEDCEAFAMQPEIKALLPEHLHVCKAPPVRNPYLTPMCTPLTLPISGHLSAVLYAMELRTNPKPAPAFRTRHPSYALPMYDAIRELELTNPRIAEAAGIRDGDFVDRYDSSVKTKRS